MWTILKLLPKIQAPHSRVRRVGLDVRIDARDVPGINYLVGLPLRLIVFARDLHFLFWYFHFCESLFD